MPRIEIDSYLMDPHYAETIRIFVKERMAGGFCVFGGKPETVGGVLSELHLLAEEVGTRLLFSCDCEYGLPMRLSDGGTEFPEAMAIAKTGEPELAYKVGQAIAREMRAICLVWNFAPVADVNSNPNNPIINTRAFGEDPKTVAEYATAYMLGLQSEGVAATAKHFPGHGDTLVDSHRELPIIEREWDSFYQLELPPFQALIQRGVWSVMTGHLAAPSLAAHLGASSEEHNLPATLSHSLTRKLLRDELGFDGVIVTDALEMKAITTHFGEEEAILLAFEAGADVLLLPHDATIAFNTILRAVQTGRIHLEDVMERANRIRTLKDITRAIIEDIRPNQLSDLKQENSMLANEVARKAIEITGSVRLTGSNMIVLTDDRPDALSKGLMFATHMRQVIPKIGVFTPTNWSGTSMEIGRDTILVTFHRARGYVSPEPEKDSVPSILRTIAATLAIEGIAPRGLVLFGSPYLDSEFQMAFGFVIKAFSESAASVSAVADTILGNNEN